MSPKPASDDQMTEFCRFITDYAPHNPLAGWRWFIDGDHAVLEPREGAVPIEAMTQLNTYDGVRGIEVVFRAKPNPGVYLQFRLGARNNG